MQIQSLQSRDGLSGADRICLSNATDFTANAVVYEGSDHSLHPVKQRGFCGWISMAVSGGLHEWMFAKTNSWRKIWLKKPVNSKKNYIK